ncbi:alpha-helical coiled-coil protein [Staphylococcus aureus]|nr:alpha-helical coiled-coil protein [Staphylococcus aureus]
MTLFLLEANNLDFASTKEELEAKAASLSTKTIPTLIEVQATENLTHGYLLWKQMTKQKLNNF